MFADAWAQLAIRHAEAFWVYADRSGERVALARAAVERARTLAPRAALTHLALGYFSYWVSRDYATATLELEEALRLQPGESQTFSALAAVARRQGRWDAAVTSGRRALALDSGSGQLYGDLGGLSLLPLRRFSESVAINSGAVLRRSTGAVLIDQVLAEAGIRGGVEPVPPSLESLLARPAAVPSDILVFPGRSMPLLRLFTGIGDAALRIGIPTDVNGRARAFLARATVLAQRGRAAESAAQAEALMAVARVLLARRPNDDAYHVLLARGYSLAGRHTEALREAEGAVALLPVTADAFTGPQHVQALAEVLVAAGEYERAIDRIAYLLSIPGFLSAWMLRADPVWAPLRGNPRFDRLAAAR